MKKLLKKLKSNAGESIGETLVALLISSLALVMLAGAITAATGIITKSSNTIKEYYDANNTLVVMGGSSTESTTMTLKGGGSVTFSDSVDVDYSKNNSLKGSDPVVSFRMQK